MSMIKYNALGKICKITIDQKSEWMAYVKRAAESDFYHTWNYHSLANDGTPVLFVYQEGDNFIAIPLLQRAIKGTLYADFHSIYGYTGPIASLPFDDIPEQLIEGFKYSFLDYIEKQNIISVFSKLHPFFHQKRLLESFGGIYDNGKTVAINLRIPIEAQRKKYRQTTMDAIKKCRKLGFKLKECSAQEDIAAFAALYQQNMNRINATEFYFFSEEYFTRLINTNEYLCKLILIYDGDEVICGSIVMCNHGIIQGHLIATNSSYLRYSPAKFLVDEVSILGRNLGMDYYHLGGGLGFKENSLFEWKLGFSDLTLDYKSWRFIANPEIYHELVIKSGNDIEDTVDFFPLYRMQNQ